MCTVSFCILYIIFTASQKSFTITVWFYSRPRYGIEYVYQSSTLKKQVYSCMAVPPQACVVLSSQWGLLNYRYPGSGCIVAGGISVIWSGMMGKWARHVATGALQEECKSRRWSRRASSTGQRTLALNQPWLSSKDHGLNFSSVKTIRDEMVGQKRLFQYRY